MKIVTKHLLLLAVFFIFFLLGTYVTAQEKVCNTPSECDQKIQEYEQKINDLRGQQKTLASTISYLNNKIQLTTTQIIATEYQLKILAEEIADLSVKIDLLDQSITDVSKILSFRIEATYKRGRLEPVLFLFSSSGFADLVSRVEYLKAVQRSDRELLIKMQTSKMNYDSQKELKQQKQTQEEALKKQLLNQQSALSLQKQAKQSLLEITQNDEKNFQQLLASARAEMEAIQSILAGQGQETKVGEIKEGERIASIIVGRSACSSGTHLHFEVAKDNAPNNPADYLRSIGIIWDNKPDGQFSFSGSWNWPMDEPIRLTQGYGNTYWSSIGWYGGGPHTGIDILSDSNNNVKTVKNGTLYRGSISCGGGTLRYVKVDNQDSNIDTYYLHVNYY